MADIDEELQDAIALCRAFGFAVIDKERIKKLSFSVAKTGNEDYYYRDKEHMDSVLEEDALQRIYEEIKQRKLIRKTSRKEKLFCDSQFDGSPDMTITTWAIDILE